METISNSEEVGEVEVIEEEEGGEKVGVDNSNSNHHSSSNCPTLNISSSTKIGGKNTLSLHVCLILNFLRSVTLGRRQRGQSQDGDWFTFD